MISIVQVKVQLAEYMTEVIELPIERFEAFEEQLGIKLEGLFASFDSEEGYISVSGDIFSINNTTIEQDLKLVISFHDSTGRVIGSDYYEIDAESFFRIDTFSETIYPPSVSISKVRVYPKPAQ
jgi:hypothetical protein